MRTNIFQHILHTGFAKGAFKRTDTGLIRIRRKLCSAVLTGWPELEHVGSYNLAFFEMNEVRQNRVFFLILQSMGFSFILILLSVLILILSGILGYYISNNRSLSKQVLAQETDFKAFERKINSIELEGLKSKMNPHLFKNILNSIQSHAYQTYFALDKLSKVLDYILYETDKKFVTLKEELEFSQNLIAINKLKLSPLFNLQIKNRIDESDPVSGKDLIAPMITVDLIENAFKHTDIQSSDAFISITFDLEDGRFSLTVANKISVKPAFKKPHSGIGKENLKRRLEILYPGCHQLSQFEENDIFIAYLKIDLLGQKTQVPVAG
jgi:LytS/YehU family sensor histidine kinase